SAQASLGVDVTNAYTAADDAIHNQTDNLFTNPKSNNPIFLVTINDSQDLNNIISNRVALEATLKNWYTAVAAPNSDQSSLATISLTTLNQVKAYLDQLALVVNDATPNGTVTASVLAGYKVNIVTARTEVGAALTTITNA